MQPCGHIRRRQNERRTIPYPPPPRCPPPRPPAPPPPLGHVASLHLHPVESGAPLQAVESIQVVEGKGITGDARFFGRLSRDTGQPTRRQVTLIEREQIVEHATALC